MKRIVFFCFMVASATMAWAQSYLGVEVGYAQTITRLNSPIQGKETTLNPKAYNGFKVGVVYDVSLVKGFGVRLGLNYTMGGYNTDWTQKNEAIKYPQVRTTGWYHQLEIPVDWQYKVTMAKNTYFILYSGPCLQYGLSLKDNKYENNGKEIVLLNQSNRYSEENMRDHALKHLNVTWGVGAGLQYERYFVRGGYDFGLINPYKALVFDVSDDYRPYTRGRFDQWQVKIGMYLWEF
jgi:hypothetical protein